MNTKPDTNKVVSVFNLDLKDPRAETEERIQSVSLHKQSRTLLKTLGGIVGRDTAQPSLFDLPRFEKNVNPYKEIISRNTAITGNLLISLWQRNKNQEGVYVIENLSEIAKILNFTPQDLKIYLVYLGGYQYPVTTLKEKVLRSGKTQKILSIYHDKLFTIRFNIKLGDKEKESDFNEDLKVGTRFLSFIKERDIESIEVKPSEPLIDDLYGNRLGNILTDEGFFAFALGLSDMAYKLLVFSGSNKPKQTIGITRLIESLQLKGQITKQGKPRVLASIKKALEELKTNGHITQWGFDEKREMFTWEYSNKIFKHKDLLPKGGIAVIREEKSNTTGN